MSIKEVFAEGSLIDIDIHMWRAEKSISPEDLGIKKEDLPDSWRLGSMSLMPKEVKSKFKHLDYEARKLLNEMSFSFPFGSARFIPKDALLEFTEKIEEIKDEYDKVTEEFIKKYEIYKLQVREDFVKGAHAAYERHVASGENGYTRDEYVNMIIEKSSHFYPAVDSLRGRFGIEYQAFQVALPDITQASYEDIASESTKMQMLKTAYEKKMQRKMEEFAQSLVQELRSRADEVLTRMKSTLIGGKRFTEKTVSMVERMIDNYQKMNFIGDTSIESRLLQFKADYLNKHSAKKIDEDSNLRREIYRELQAIVTLVNDEQAMAGLTKAYRERVGV